MQLHGKGIWTRLLLVVLRQQSFLDLSIVLLKNHGICKPLGEVLFEKGWTSTITWRLYLSGKHGEEREAI